MKKLSSILFIFLCALQLSSAQNTNNDVPYGDEPKQNMDVYLPQQSGNKKTPAIILIHGGSWIGGDKQNMNHWARVLQKRLPGYAIFNLNYRLANRQTGANLWPVAIDDVDKAFTFIKQKAKDYHIDDKKIVLLGESAGAQLALVEGYTHNEDKAVKVVVDLFGPADMADIYAAHHELALFMKGTPADHPAVYDNASAVDQVTQKTPPTIIFHGTADPLVPIRESDSLNTRLKEAKVPSEFITYPGKGHGWREPEIEDTYTKAIAFIKAHI